MIVTRKKLTEKIIAYLKHRIAIEHLVNWAEEIMMEGSVEDKYADEIVDVVSRLGVADVKAFGLTWEDCQSILHKLGCEIEINVKMVA